MAKTPNNPQCATCRNFHPTSADSGECRGGLPELGQCDPKGLHWGYWPQIKTDKWCGHYKARKQT